MDASANLKQSKVTIFGVRWGHYFCGSTGNVTAGSSGTNYTTSNPAIATITADGLVTAVSSGTVVIQASNDGASGIRTVMVSLGGASIGGIPVSWIIANHLDPNDPNLQDIIRSAG